jgi:[ribosomal protein S18]-alanine N-acetyltransferase
VSFKAVSQLLCSHKGREEWFSLGENHEKFVRFGVHQLRNRWSVRAMTAQDIDDVLVLAASSVEAPHWTRRDYEQILCPEALTRCGVVALSGDSCLTGFAVASWLAQETAAEIEGLVVAEKYRRQGIGSALIAACMAWAAESGASSIRLEVRASNTAALALYHRRGFSAAGRRRDYYSTPVEDAVLLQAPLAQTPL